MRIGVVVTGSEVYKGLIEDRFSPVVIEKVTKLGCGVIGKVNASDSIEMVSDSVKSLLREGAELILITCGMSVDPDDLTPAGVVAAGGTIVAYGAPVLPGSMCMVAYIDETPVLGLPGCVMYSKNTVFDLLFPHILAGERITRRDVTVLGHGGLCANCSPCSMEVQLGADADGKITAYTNSIIAENGAHTSVGVVIMDRAIEMLGGAYNLPNVQAEGNWSMQ
jgi:molybdopterin biosynthesis enzyme